MLVLSPENAVPNAHKIFYQGSHRDRCRMLGSWLFTTIFFQKSVQRSIRKTPSKESVQNSVQICSLVIVIVPVGSVSSTPVLQT